MSEPVRFYSGDPGWVFVIPVCNPALHGSVPSKVESLINSDILLKFIFNPLASWSYTCIFLAFWFTVLMMFFLFSVFLMLWHLGLYNRGESVHLIATQFF